MPHPSFLGPVLSKEIQVLYLCPISRISELTVRMSQRAGKTYYLWQVKCLVPH